MTVWQSRVSPQLHVQSGRPSLGLWEISVRRRIFLQVLPPAPGSIQIRKGGYTRDVKHDPSLCGIPLCLPCGLARALSQDRPWHPPLSKMDGVRAAAATCHGGGVAGIPEYVCDYCAVLPVFRALMPCTVRRCCASSAAWRHSNYPTHSEFLRGTSTGSSALGKPLQSPSRPPITAVRTTLSPLSIRRCCKMPLPLR